MTILHSLILGIVEGITEFLPISSTGHLILVSHLLRIEQVSFTKSFEIIIQLGAILAVIVLYWKSFLNIHNLKKIMAAFIPTGIIGLVLYNIVKIYLMGSESVVLWALLLGGVALIVFEFWYSSQEQGSIQDEPESESLSVISYKQAVGIGLFQTLAMVPGVSRSAATIVGGLMVGLKRKTIVEFSFLLAVPTMLAASGLDLFKNASSFSSDQFGTLTVGFVVSFVVALFSIKFLLNFIKKHNFTPFGVYRIVVAIIFWLIILR